MSGNSLGRFQYVWHVGAVEIRSEAYMIGARDFYSVIDVLDDFYVPYSRQFPPARLASRVSLSPSSSWQTSLSPQRFVTTSLNGGVDFRISLFGVSKFLA